MYNKRDPKFQNKIKATTLVLKVTEVKYIQKNFKASENCPPNCPPNCPQYYSRKLPKNAPQNQ